MPGIGPIIASAIVASVADASVFRSGREFAAWLGLVPKQSGTGGKTWLGRISKRGDGYIRRLLVTGALTALTRSKAVKALPWIEGMKARQKRPMVIAVATRQQDGSDRMGDDGPRHRVSCIGGLIPGPRPPAGAVDSLRRQRLVMV